MGGDSHDSDSIKLPEFIVLELLRNGPWDQVTTGSQTALHLLSDIGLTDFTFKCYLNSAKNVWKLTIFRSLFKGSQQHEDLVSGRIGQHLQIIGRVLIVT